MTHLEVEPKVGIIIVAHADYGSALLRTTEFIMGTLSGCSSISIDAAFDPTQTIQRLTDAVELLDEGIGVLILTDMFGGTPTNLSLSLLSKYQIEVVTGANLPMLLKVFSDRRKPLRELAEIAGEAGKTGIVDAGNMLNTKV